MLGFVAAGFNQESDFLRNDARLARARTGQHQTGAVHVLHRFALRGIESGLHEEG